MLIGFIFTIIPQGRKGFSWPTGLREAKAGMETHTTEDSCLLACSLGVAAFSNTWLVLVHSGTINQQLRKCPHGHAHRPAWWKQSSGEVLPCCDNQDKLL